MGYSTVHDIVMEKDNDEITIISDSYDESLILGVVSTDYVENIGSSLASISSVLVENEFDVEKINTEFASSISGKSISSTTSYNVNKAIEYADTYVIHSYISEDGGQDKSYYNSAFPKYSSDCCNYVSQCLLAGGLCTDSEWYSSSVAYQDSNAWRRVSYLVPYLKEKYTDLSEDESVSATNSSVFPGNPVYTNSYGHIMICVGYNASGIPILNAHTNDAYHVPLSFFGSNISTIQIATENLNINTPTNAINMGTVTGLKSAYGTLDGLEADYYYFQVSSDGFYDIYTEGYLDTMGYLYTSSYTVDNVNLYMYEIERDDDEGESYNFSMHAYLNAGTTYYVKVTSFDADTDGSYGIYVLQNN